MSSCQCNGCDSQFGAEHAVSDLKRYRENGPDRHRHARSRDLLLSEHGATGLDVRLQGEPLVRRSVSARPVAEHAWVTLENLGRRIIGNPFRKFVHPVAAIDDLLKRNGLKRQSVRDTFVWRVAVYARQ